MLFYLSTSATENDHNIEPILPSLESLNSSAYEAMKQGRYKESYLTSLKVRELSTQSKDFKQQARAISNIASTSVYLGNFQEALTLYQQSLDISKQIDDIDGKESTLNNISGIYTRLGNHDEALQYLLKLPVLNGVKRPKEKALVAYLGLATRYSDLKNTTLANRSLQTAKEILDNYENPFLRVYYLLTAAEFKQSEQRLDQSMSLLDKAETLSRNNSFSGLVVSSQYHKAEVLFEKNEIAKSKQIALEALDLAEKVSLKTQTLNIHNLLLKIEKANGFYKEALDRKDIIDQISEGIRGENVLIQAEITKINRQVEETEKKLAQSIQLQKISELKLETQTQSQIIISVILFFSGTLIFFWYRRKMVQKELQRHKQLNQELKELDILKDRILTNTSHELRTPLNGIIGLSDIILAEYQDTIDDELKQSIELIGKSGNQLSDIVNDILDLAQLKAKKMAFQYDKFSPSILIKEVIALCQPLLTTNKNQINFESKDDTLEITQDEKRVQQVLFNIIGNAVKFTPTGSVEVSFSVEKENLFISVKDTGIGIPKDKIERIFQGFEQVNAGNSRTTSGTGLGLAISKEIALALGGDIALKSELGKGTTVSFYFPIKKGRN